MAWVRSVLLVTFLSLLAPLVSAIDSFALPEDPATLKRYQVLSEEFRCLVCQNQNLADSNAELAKDLKIELVTLLESGKSDQEIREFLVARYGDFVLLRPDFNLRYSLLWISPFMVVIVSILFFYFRLKNQSHIDLNSQNQKLDTQTILQELSREDYP